VGWREYALLAAALLSAIASTLWAGDLIDPAAPGRWLRDLGPSAPVAFDGEIEAVVERIDAALAPARRR
jgi:hypothetical protein